MEGGPAGTPPCLDPGRIEALLKGCGVGGTILCEASVLSTHDWARQEADRRPHGTLFLADAQSAGRGRGARTWFSPPGHGLYWTLLLKPAEGEVASRRLGLFNLMVALEAALAVEETEGVRCRLKWPNDLLLEGRKVGGILLEAASRGEWVQHAVVSLGLNVNTPVGDFPPEIAATATSLASHTGRLHDREGIAAALARRTSRLWDRLPAMDQAGALREWTDRSAGTRGARVRFLRRGGVEVVGVTEGLTTEGFLRLRLEDGEVTALDGEILEVLREEGGRR